ncbi:hypothetical protein [Acinetobacter sp. ANC 5502]
MTTFAVIYNTKNEVRITHVQKLIEKYDQFIQVGLGFWLVDCKGDPVGIKNYLKDAAGPNGSLFVFEVTKEWSIDGNQEVLNWLNDR